jgi:hypothetical protein
MARRGNPGFPILSRVLQHQTGSISAEAIQKNFDQVQPVFQALAEKDLLDYQIVDDVALSAGHPLDVKHGLGRAYRGWLVINRNAAVTPYESARQRARTHLTLTAPSAVTISLLIF